MRKTSLFYLDLVKIAGLTKKSFLCFPIHDEGSKVEAEDTGRRKTW